VESNISVNGN